MGEFMVTGPATAPREPSAPPVRRSTLAQAAMALSVSFLVIVLGLRLRGGMIVPLAAGTCVAALFGLRLGFRWKEIQASMFEGIGHGLPAIVILMLVGMTIGVWILGGAVPTMVYYGLKLIVPKLFLATSFVLCAVVSTATGTSFGTIGTVGLALIGIGASLGLPLPAVAGSIVAGSYFGDKMSTLSDTTNVAPAMAGAGLFEHIGSMMYTTMPAFVVSLVAYGVMGAKFGTSGSGQNVSEIMSALRANFVISPLTLIPPLAVIVMSIKRVPAIPALAVGAVFSGVWALIIQGTTTSAVLVALTNGFVAKTGIAFVDTLLTRGGVNSVLATTAVIMIATAFGGILERTNVLSTVVEALLRKIKSTGSLIVSVIASCYLVTLVLGNQMLAIILPGRMFRSAFVDRGIAARVLSRTLEDAGTLGAALVPWSTAGLFIFGVLKVPVASYAPYALLNWVVPIFSIAFAYTGFAIFKVNESKGGTTNA